MVALKSGIEITVPQDYTLNLSERDAFLQACFDWMFNHSMACTAEELASFQDTYNIEACQAFFDDNYNGW